MKYFKNTELAKLYNVSEKSVRNWIDAAQTGKLELQLFDKNGKQFVANTTKNTSLIEKLVEKGKKYKNTRGYKTITPLPKFYESFTEKEIVDIITSITNYREIPLKYTYLDGGAEQWDAYANRLLTEQTPNILNQTIGSLDGVSHYLDQLVGDRKVNIVDLGPGNGLPVRTLLEHFMASGQLNRYIAIDASHEMLTILEKNIKDWFGDKIKCETYVRDFSNERFDDILSSDYMHDLSDTPVNIALSLGGTLDNFKMPDYALRTINASLRDVNDLFIYSGSPDTYQARRYFDFAPQPNQKLRVEIFFELIGLDDSLYTYELSFNPEKQARYGHLRPKVDLSLKFQLNDGVKQVELTKNEPIVVWRHLHRSSVETIRLFDKSDFDIVQLLKSANGQFPLVIAKIKVDDSAL